MASLKFLYGKDISRVDKITPGTFYLDTETNELWYDDPSSLSGQHIRLFNSRFDDIIALQNFLAFTHLDINSPDYDLFIDTNNIVVTLLDGGTTPDRPPESGITSAKLGAAVLGSMILGQE